jgi:siroheme synthase (precorrin-2 oxidase/ferrochelatase)
MTHTEDTWEKEFDERFVRDDGLMDKCGIDIISGEDCVMADAIKSFIRSLLQDQREEVVRIIGEDEPLVETKDGKDWMIGGAYTRNQFRAKLRSALRKNDEQEYEEIKRVAKRAEKMAREYVRKNRKVDKDLV